MTDDARTFKHVFRLDPDTGFFHCVQNGTMTEEDAVEMLAIFARHARPGDPVFALADDRNATAMTPGARKVFATQKLDEEIYLALFGGSFAFRVVVTLFLKVMSLAKPKFTGVVVADEAEGLAWLKERKRAYLARPAKVIA